MSENGFAEYKQLFLKEFARFDKSIDSIGSNITEVNEKLTIIDQNVKSLNAQIDTINYKFQDHETRVRSLEKGFWKLLGGISLASFLIQVVIKFL